MQWGLMRAPAGWSGGPRGIRKKAQDQGRSVCVLDGLTGRPGAVLVQDATADVVLAGAVEVPRLGPPGHSGHVCEELAGGHLPEWSVLHFGRKVPGGRGGEGGEARSGAGHEEGGHRYVVLMEESVLRYRIKDPERCVGQLRHPLAVTPLVIATGRCFCRSLSLGTRVRPSGQRRDVGVGSLLAKKLLGFLCCSRVPAACQIFQCGLVPQPCG